MTAARFPSEPIDWFLIGILIAAAVPAAAIAIRTRRRRCIACRQEFTSVAARLHHQHIAHQL